MGLNQQQIEAEFTALSSFSQLTPPPLYIFDTITSTNQVLRELLEEGKTAPLAAIATQQTTGQGQWGRTWHSPPGGLYLSVALDLQIPATDVFHLTLFSAWGIANALRTQNIPVGLKWPNDLVLQGRKLGGIKSETRTQQGMINQAIIGIGINWKNPVPVTGINLHSFLTAEAILPISSLEQLAAITLDGLFKGYQHYRSQGIDSLRASYLELLDSLGRSIDVQGVTGVITGVTSQGQLQVCLRSPGAKTEIYLSPGSISLGYGEIRG